VVGTPIQPSDNIRVEVDPPTLADRLLAETLAHDGCVIGPPMTGAWVRLPGAG
jgi:hypothetical protein